MLLLQARGGGCGAHGDGWVGARWWQVWGAAWCARVCGSLLHCVPACDAWQRRPARALANGATPSFINVCFQVPSPAPPRLLWRSPRCPPMQGPPCDGFCSAGWRSGCCGSGSAPRRSASAAVRTAGAPPSATWLKSAGPRCRILTRECNICTQARTHRTACVHAALQRLSMLRALAGRREQGKQEVEREIGGRDCEMPSFLSKGGSGAGAASGRKVGDGAD